MRGTPHRYADRAQEVGQPADMVLVAMRDEDAPDPVSPLDQPVEVGVNDVDTQVVAWEANAGMGANFANRVSVTCP